MIGLAVTGAEALDMDWIFPDLRSDIPRIMALYKPLRDNCVSGAINTFYHNRVALGHPDTTISIGDPSSYNYYCRNHGPSINPILWQYTTPFTKYHAYEYEAMYLCAECLLVKMKDIGITKIKPNEWYCSPPSE